VRTKKVILIGGAPGAGKSTLGRALAARLEIGSLTIDDLLVATRAVTTRASHPGLHLMNGISYIEYFTRSEPARLIADAERQEEAIWPATEKVIRSHAAPWGTPIVIDGWTLRPRRVVELGLENVTSFWLVVEPTELERRERANAEFVRDSPEPERMLRNFLARSLWHNDLLRRQANELGLPVLRQDGIASVEDLCDLILGTGA